MTPPTQSEAVVHRVPRERGLRDRLRSAVAAYADAHHLVPPLSIEELQSHASRIVAATPDAADYVDFVALLVGNTVWRETLASVPYERRVLLLPQCLRPKDTCPAEMDELGVLCEQCGRCAIGTILAEAEELGYVALVAEGTTVVTRLLESGKVDAVIGVSCLSVLEKAFPRMSAHAIPGIAIPLLRDGCACTEVDQDWVLEAVRLKSSHCARAWLNLDTLTSEVAAWFRMDPLRDLLGAGTTQTETTALRWLAKSGKRWRPFLAAAVFRALDGTRDGVPEGMRKLAVAVECFHKASLVHDDIEDNDDFRYGEMTLHRELGVPVALNVGDLLLGEGYRLISECGADGERCGRMFAAATTGHRDLCLGQGEELNWTASPGPPSTRAVLELFRRKTSPAFGVALSLGAIYGGAEADVCVALNRFSESLGIAYQIRDDLEDFTGGDEHCDAASMRLSFLLAAAYEAAGPEDQAFLEAMWRGEQRDGDGPQNRLKALVSGVGAAEKGAQMFEHFKREALRSLSDLQNADLKHLLHRITGRILNGT